MHAATVLCSALTLASTALSIPTSGEHNLVARQVPSKPCSTGVHVIASGGDGAQNTGKYGLIGTLSTKILQNIPGSTNVTLPYDKSRTDGKQVQDLNQGATLLHNYIADYHQYCPNTKIVLLGYSAGAIITMNTLCGATSPFSTPPGPIGSGGNPGLTSKIIAAVLYGDQTRTPGPGYDLGTGGQSCVGRFARSNDNRCVSSFQYQSYCDSGDPECCPNSSGQNAQIHFEYPQKYDNAATQFVVNRYKAT